MKFKEGDKVIKARPYSTLKYCRRGGTTREVPLGTKGMVKHLSHYDDEVNVRFENGTCWNLHVSELDHIFTSWKDRYKK